MNIKLLAALPAAALLIATAEAANLPVIVTRDAESLTLANGLVTARISSRSGALTSLRYDGLELIAQHGSGAGGGYWSSVGRGRPSGSNAAEFLVNPATNGGSLAVVVVRSRNDPASPGSPADVDLCYALGSGAHWLYAWAVWQHAMGFPPLGVGEARYCLKLNPEVFDFLTVDSTRRRLMPSGEDWDRGAPLNLKEARRMTTGVHRGETEDKYSYAAAFSATPAYGWSSTRHNVGLWIINPSLEFVGGGPTKMELTGHLDVNPGGLPTLLNMWLGSHYGGTALSVAREETWTKFIGPFVIYCNSLPMKQTNAPTSAAAEAAQERLWKDALQRATTEAARWPFDWLQHPEYPGAAARGTVTGKLELRDAWSPGQTLSNAWVGLTVSNYPPSLGRGWNRGFPADIDWQRDAKFYQFWVRPDAQGNFTIRNVRPGSYWLRAISDGVIGEFTATNVTVSAGATNALGSLAWQPERFGRTLWEIGVPNRNAREFRNGTNAWQWGTYLKYAADFPNDVNFIIGTSDWRHDWNYVQPPRLAAPRGDTSATESEDDTGDDRPELPRALGRSPVQSTTWTIRFKLPEAASGKAALRLAFCGTHTGCNVEAFVNGHSIGDTGLLPPTSAMQRDGVQAYWTERPLSFDAVLLTPGANTIQLLSHANSWSQGVLYDVVRLELEAPPQIK